MPTPEQPTEGHASQHDNSHLRDGTCSQSLHVAFWLVVASGIILRIVAGTQSLGFVHPDEHQQYLEAAQKIVHGYGWTYWEYERGVRHYLYPGILAALLWSMDFIGINDPVHQAMVIRVLMGLSVLGAMTLYAHRWLITGRHVAGLTLICMTAWSPDMIFIGARTLSETAMLVPLLLGLHILERRPFPAGVLFALMFAVRFQSAFVTAGIFLAILIEDFSERRPWRSSQAVKLAVGLAVGLLLVGAIDRVTWGSWFHSPIAYFRINLLEGKAASFGVDPWYRYLQWTVNAFLEASVILVPLIVIGAVFDIRLACALYIFFSIHSLVGHKEPRFLWPAVPLLMSLAALGTEVIWKRLDAKLFRAVFALLLVGNLSIGAAFRFDRIDWHCEPTQSTSLALAQLGKRDDVNGVAVYGIGDAYCGNYFYLRKNIPLVPHPHGPSVFEHPKWQDGTINYMLIEEWRTPPASRVRLQPTATVGALSICRVIDRIAFVPDLGRFVIRNPEDPIQLDLSHGQPWENDAIPIFEQYISKGMCVADIGAYNGVHTVRFAHLVGKAGHVYAFEPNPPALDMLEQNIHLNGLDDRVTCYPYAVADAASIGFMRPSDDAQNLGGSHVVTSNDIPSGRLGANKSIKTTSLEVAMIRIDDDISKWFPRRVGFVKIDVEGDEDRVIEGSRNWLAAHRPVIYVEIWNDEKRASEKLQSSTAQMIEMVEQMNYRLVRRIGKWDYLFIPQ